MKVKAWAIISKDKKTKETGLCGGKQSGIFNTRKFAVDEINYNYNFFYGVNYKAVPCEIVIKAVRRGK